MSLKTDYNYFADRDYSDYRELVCFERPTAVLLHYEHSIYYLRLWLYDRFDFEWRDSELTTRHNSFDFFLKSSGIVKHNIVTIRIENVEDFISKLFNDKADAVLVNYFSRIGESVVVSTLMLEKDQAELLATSLRGDSFYIRKLIQFNELKDKLHLVNNSFEYFTIHIPNSLPSGQDTTLKEITHIYNLKSSFKNAINNFRTYKKLGNNITGAQALKAAFNDKIKDFCYWENKVKSGFDNALLVEFFWPIQFAYKPFLIYLSYLDRNNLISYYLDNNACSECDHLEKTKVELEIHQLIKNSESNSEILSNLGILFGKRPTEKRFNDFTNQFMNIIKTYEDIENIILVSDIDKLES
jgi:hypothetical protein